MSRAPFHPSSSSAPDIVTQAELDRRVDESVARAGLFAIDAVARIVGVPVERLRNWDRLGIACASVVVRGKRHYGFQDLLGVRRVKALVEQGIPPRRIKRAVEGLRRCAATAGEQRPTELQLGAVGKDIVVTDPAGHYDALSGQLLLSFDEKEKTESPILELRERKTEPQHRQHAYEHYLQGCRLDESEGDIDSAQAAYHHALSLDPALACAHTNLGNCYYRRGWVEEAIDHFESALRIDPEQPEALYNLGFLLFETGVVERSLVYFQRALDSDPSFVDAHVSLAMAYEELNHIKEAVAHWEAAVSLQPQGPWASYALERLNHVRRSD